MVKVPDPPENLPPPYARHAAENVVLSWVTPAREPTPWAPSLSPQSGGGKPTQRAFLCVSGGQPRSASGGESDVSGARCGWHPFTKRGDVAQALVLTDNGVRSPQVSPPPRARDNSAGFPSLATPYSHAVHTTARTARREAKPERELPGVLIAAAEC
jgi:hypothetical protein